MRTICTTKILQSELLAELRLNVSGAGAVPPVAKDCLENAAGENRAENYAGRSILNAELAWFKGKSVE